MTETETPFEELSDEVVRAAGLKKTFQLSRKQRKIERTDETKKVAVDGLSFSARRGEIYGLLGPNGAGKTTTLRMISTLIKPDAGDAFVCGHSIVKEPEKVRDKIGFMTSELKLEGFFTPNYLFDFFGAMHGVEKSVLEARKKTLFERFEIDKFAEVRVKDLSTGMKQKVSLVVSIVHDPEVVIFDEPTNGLDILTAKVVTDFLLELKAMNKSILLSTHIFSLVEKLCDRVGIILDGKMTVEGTLKEVCGEGTLEDKFFSVYLESKGVRQ
ncbi:MAG: ABC transporter ATP-binding protein [Clostridia bacterium]|nr:ABC transporter ATP-binding protein [Clostridia bacterium]